MGNAFPPETDFGTADAGTSVRVVVPKIVPYSSREALGFPNGALGLPNGGLGFPGGGLGNPELGNPELGFPSAGFPSGAFGATAPAHQSMSRQHPEQRQGQ